MNIQIENRQSRVKIDRRRLRGMASRVLKELDAAGKEISISLVDDETIRTLNKRYLGKDKPTNVLSFSLQEGDCGDINPDLLGDVVISVDTAQRDAAKARWTTEQEIVYLLIHGILHLLGYNHENTSRRESLRMHQKEKELFLKIYPQGDPCL
ncbi:MAG TPA: rRNA maturation RNase YbeY [Smithella sp.]|nr:rRNA maturation RNase YbeY [Smithella sp.]